MKEIGRLVVFRFYSPTCRCLPYLVFAFFKILFQVVQSLSSCHRLIATTLRSRLKTSSFSSQESRDVVQFSDNVLPTKYGFL